MFAAAPTYDLFCEFESSGCEVDLLIFLRHCIVHVDLEKGEREKGEGAYTCCFRRDRRISRSEGGVGCMG